MKIHIHLGYVLIGYSALEKVMINYMTRFQFSLLLTILLPIAAVAQFVNDKIVLINVEKIDKGRMAKGFVEVIKLNPKVISIDVALRYRKVKEDLELMEALDRCDKIVFPTSIHYLGKDAYDKDILSFVSECDLVFRSINAKSGYVSAEMEKDKGSVPKKIILRMDVDGYQFPQYHFSMRTAMKFDSLKTLNFVNKHGVEVDFDYKNGTRRFKSFSLSEVLEGKLTKKDIEGKIVMFGFLGPGDVDKFFSPRNLNHKERDIYGVEYLANIVAQILE